MRVRIYIYIHVYHTYIYTQMYTGYSIFIELSYIDINTDICITYISVRIYEMYIHIQITSYA